MTDLVPQAIRDLLAFYKERYPEARFGDLDVTVLQQAVNSIDEAAQAVVQAEELVAAARASFRDVEVEISQKAARALSFLKIFVDGDEEPLAKLEVISASMPATRRKAKSSGDAEASLGEPRQRRTRKSKISEETAAAQTATSEVALDPVLEADIEALLTEPGMAAPEAPAATKKQGVAATA